MQAFETLFAQFIAAELPADAAHDLNHVKRVVKTAKRLCQLESANVQVVVPSAWLHDCVTLAKDDPRRSQSSLLAADKAIAFLKRIDYPQQYHDAIHHVIHAHSFSARVTPETLEAKIVQDADRLDALGAIGVVRCLQVGTTLGRPLYHAEDPFCQHREADDSRYTLDHFKLKLFTLADTMQTAAAREEARHRTRVMQDFLDQLAQEI
ncbi:HD domain-containing protein [Shewanella sp. Isolate7]|uniref:HD domain-containing protein n=1 Tax=Shewanella sp. Isolate7 TaxID=2908528 RepID=UPI001EFDD4AB|nr:HD domain-containing protein [Shewanella sp. Isolate7]MCG9720509.1 HD domain-containing protein [Shewanella sp. Isolate7]